jgi:hypothetical protein
MNLVNFKRFAFWFGVEFFLYGMVVANGRAYNQAHYGWTLITDMIISWFNFYVAVKFIEGKENRDHWSMAGCVMGGGLGSVTMIFVTKFLYGA